MTKRILVCLFLIFAVLVSVNPSAAQFFYNGRGSASLKWYQIKSDKYRILYPDYFQPTAIRLSGFLDTIYPYIGCNMPARLIKTPIILYTENQHSNGMVVWAPKRDEMVVTPPIANTSTPWLKQLAIHEWRHVVQMSAMKTGLTKIATWGLGEAGLAVGLLVISDWQLEGDATNAETQLSEFGRGLQPEFTLEYRGMATNPKFLKLSTDKLICGSYKDNIPDIYKYGYQVMRAAETYLGQDIWGKVFDYSAKWPILVVPDYFYLRKNYKTSIRKITKRTFRELDSIWQPFESVNNNYQTVTKPSRSYTTYQDPLILPDHSVLALKKDFDNPTRYVRIYPNNKEEKLEFTGGISSRPILFGNKILWTEYKPHPIYEFKNFSVIREFDILSGKCRRYHNWQSNYLVTPLASGYATVANDSLANGYIRFFDDDFHLQSSYRFSEPTTLHGLAYDSLTKMLCFIAVDENGMWFGALDENRNMNTLRAASAVTLSDLRAHNGMLYFGSIQSGKDEIHSMRIDNKNEYQLTVSRFGASQADVLGSVMYMRTYTPEGWLISKQIIDTTQSVDKVEWSRLPRNILNPKRVKWQVPNTDTIVMGDTVTGHDIKRYSKFGRQFNIHSWAPIAIDMDRLLNERSLRWGFGATGFFQSTLSDMYGYLALGAANGQFWGLGTFTYTGLPVQLSAVAEYGGGNQLIYYPHSVIPDKSVKLKPYFSFTGNIFMPLNFSGGSSLRLLKPSFSITHYNALMYDPDIAGFNNGFQKWSASLWWSSNRRLSYRNIVPRLGYALQTGISGTFDKRFSMMSYLWGRGYLPGILPNHSITIRATAQYQERNEFNFSSKVMVPRGVVDNYSAEEYCAWALDYTFPMIYPDWGVDGVIYFKRITMNIFGDYSVGNYFTSTSTTSLNHHSVGFDLTVDFNLFRSIEQVVTLSFAFPESKSLFFSLGYNVKF